MGVARVLVDVLGPPRARTIVDAALGAVGLVAGVLALATGLPPLALGGVVVLCGVTEWARDRAIRRRLLAIEDVPDARDRGVRSALGSVAGNLDLRTEPTPLPATGLGGVTALKGPDGPVLLYGPDVVGELPADRLEGVLAHELAHWRLGHLTRPPLRDPIAHLVGFVALWGVVLQHLATPTAVAAGALFFLTAAGRRDATGTLAYVLFGLGIVVLPMALAAVGDRIEEFQADDVAVGVVGATTYGRALERIVDRSSSTADEETGPEDATDRSRGVLERLFGRHPPLDARLDRQRRRRGGDSGAR